MMDNWVRFTAAASLLDQEQRQRPSRMPCRQHRKCRPSRPMEFWARTPATGVQRHTHRPHAPSAGQAEEANRRIHRHMAPRYTWIRPPSTCRRSMRRDTGGDRDGIDQHQGQQQPGRAVREQPDQKGHRGGGGTSRLEMARWWPNRSREFIAEDARRHRKQRIPRSRRWASGSRRRRLGRRQTSRTLLIQVRMPYSSKQCAP